jgi:anti-sigma regulatory factor (Ser/Thr protein kinase)
VDVHLHDQVLEVAIVDDAAAFNPLEARPPDTASGLDERPIGGLGIHVVRKLMDEMAYERREGRNRLTLRKRIADQERRDGHP